MPVRACQRHGRGDCATCKARRRAYAQANRRPYSGTALEREMRAAVVATYGSNCHYCLEAIDVEGATGDPQLALVMAHVIAHADGGGYTVENLRPAHAVCNLRAGR